MFLSHFVFHCNCPCHHWNMHSHRHLFSYAYSMIRWPLTKKVLVLSEDYCPPLIYIFFRFCHFSSYYLYTGSMISSGYAWVFYIGLLRSMWVIQKFLDAISFSDRQKQTFLSFGSFTFGRYSADCLTLIFTKQTVMVIFSFLAFM